MLFLCSFGTSHSSEVDPLLFYCLLLYLGILTQTLEEIEREDESFPCWRFFFFWLAIERVFSTLPCQLSRKIKQAVWVTGRWIRVLGVRPWGRFAGFLRLVISLLSEVNTICHNMEKILVKATHSFCSTTSLPWLPYSSNLKGMLWETCVFALLYVCT